VAGWSAEPAQETRELAPLGTTSFAAIYSPQPAHIDSIVDVPNDQGGWARLHFTRCGLDLSIGDWPDTVVSAYNVHRKVDDALLAQAVLTKTSLSKTVETAEPGAKTALPGPLESREASRAIAMPPAGDDRLIAHADRWFLIGRTPNLACRDSSAKEAPPGVWEVVQTVLARQQPRYLALVPTLADSTAFEPIQWTHYFVSAHTTIPSVFYDSAPDSGYSTDNIAPGVPTGFQVSYAAAGNDLQWDPAPEADFQYHRIYRSESADFEPSPSLLVHATSGTAWTDPDGTWSDHYKVATVDHAGNEGPAAAPDVLSTAEDLVPTVFALGQNQPNPFNPATTILFDLPRSCRVDLRIYDVSGRLIRTLHADEPMPAGRRSAVWQAQDDSGRSVAAGVYYYRLKAGSHLQTRSMVLVK
jgi:hypothetical protein